MGLVLGLFFYWFSGERVSAFQKKKKVNVNFSRSRWDELTDVQGSKANIPGSAAKHMFLGLN